LKIIYITRLFSGIEKSFLSNNWPPSGVPTIYKMIEELDRLCDMCFIFTAKDSGAGYQSIWNAKLDKTIKIDELNHKLSVLAGINYFPSILGRKLRIILREFRHFFKIFFKIVRYKPDIIYCDHANIFHCSIVARLFTGTPVVFRVMGVNKFMRNVSEGMPGLIYSLYRWAYRAPFRLVLCTQDGSGVELWIKNSIHKDVWVKKLINGVDSPVLSVVKDDRIIKLSNKLTILFVGKLESYKGCVEFVKAIILLLNNNTSNIHALIIGFGTQYNLLKKITSKNNNFTFIEHLSHDQILAVHKKCDIYVSMNHLGNLSNANLEAINSNDCMIIPEPQFDYGIDIITEKLLGNSVTYVPINNAEKLSKSLHKLTQSKGKRDLFSDAISKQKLKFLWSWDERIKAEVELLKKLL
jgi:glycosyltransferase involved in cell wall biosynthesis